MVYAKNRKEAIAMKHKKYFTGIPCMNGHRTMRYTRTGACMTCVAITARGYREAARNRKELGIQRITLSAHPHDVKILQDLAEQLLKYRGLEKYS